MDIYKIARKLEPLMPKEVGHWLKTRDLADPDLKALIEKEIILDAYRVLGDFRNKLLLSLPPENKSKGSFHLGTILYEKEKWPFGIRKEGLLQNVAIFGRSGAGKTNVTFHILEQLVEKKIPFLFLDWKRTGRHLLPRLKRKVSVYTPGRNLSSFPFNPFIPPPGLEEHLYINHLIDVMASAYSLGEGAKYILQTALAHCYEKKKWPSVQDVLASVDSQVVKGRAHGWQISAIRAVRSLAFSTLTTKQETDPHELVSALVHGNTIIELDGLNEGGKKFLIPMLCLWIYYVQLQTKRREELQLVVFVEEAHHVLFRQEHRSKESVMNMLLRQCREIGIGMIVIDQHPHLISSAALGNAYTSICLNQKDPLDINRAAGISLVSEDEKKWFSMLSVGQAIVKLQDRWRTPFLVQFPLVEISKGLVNDEVLAAFSSGSMARSGLKRLLDKELRQERQVRGKDSVVSDNELLFIEDIRMHGDDGVRVRYKRLGFSVDKGTRVKQGLIEKGVIEEEVVKVGGSRKVLLRVTQRARDEFGLGPGNMTRGSLAHEYWKKFYADLFQERGYEVEFESLRRYGRVDVVAQKGPERVAIEVETGKSDVVWNVREDLLAKFNRILVVATDERAMRRVERQLARAGFLIPSRVRLILRDEFAKKFDKAG